MKKIINTKVIRMTRIGNGKNPERESELRIMGAMEALSNTERGRAVLDDLALIFDGKAKGLDSSGMSALVCLVRDFAFGGRRGFLMKRKGKRGDELTFGDVQAACRQEKSRLQKPSAASQQFNVFRDGIAYRKVFDLSAEQACDRVRADDSNAGEYLPVESYTAYPL